VLAFTFLCVKSYEYRDKFLHYEVKLKNGTIADGHMLANNPKDDFILLHHVRVVKTHAELMEPAKPEALEAELKILRADIQDHGMGNYGPWHNSYLAIYFVITGLHALHIIGGALVIGFMWGPGSKMWFTNREHFTNRIEVSGLFWHFVDLVWIFLFPVLYLM